MTYPDWILEQLEYYRQVLERLEREREWIGEDLYQERRATLTQNIKMYEEIYDEPPIERDSA